MKIVNIAFLALALNSAGAAAECTGPELPTLPDGGKASMEDMLAGQKAVKAYQTANVEYMQCLETAFTAAEEVLKNGSDEDKAAAQSTYDEAIDAYNAAVSAEEELAGQFNTEIREFKAANPG